ncbi:MAG: hypothetical protein DMF74_16560 [Acidobacteria bacterium]|nr:MAG: hypothetical protein DMF74_16560 [Acidobacteriota bacterium]
MKRSQPDSTPTTACRKIKTGFRPRSGQDENSPAIYRWGKQRDWTQSAKRTTETGGFTRSAVRFAD